MKWLKKDFPIGTKVFNIYLNKEGEVIGYDDDFAIPSVVVKFNFGDIEVNYYCTSSTLKKEDSNDSQKI